MNTQKIATLIDGFVPAAIGLALIFGRARIVSKIDDLEKRAKTDRVLQFVGPAVLIVGLLTLMRV